MKTGKLIVIEGLDGCGKTTQAHRLAESLTANGHSVKLEAEPTDGEIGRLIRRILSGKVKAEPATVAALFAADRIEHNFSIAQNLKSGVSVICDRYYYSSLAYQGMGADPDWVRQLNLDCPYIQKPDFCIFLEAPVDVCLSRIHEGRNLSDLEIFENRQSLMTVKQRFDEIFAVLPEENIIRLNAEGAPEQIANRIWQAVEPFFQ